MKLTIHDVGHGGCISLVHSNGNAMLWDVGHQGDNRPSSILPNSGINSVEYLFITNYDEDHVSDMPEFRSKVGIRAVYRNKSISPTALRALKLKGGPISPAMDSTLDLLSGLSEGLMSPLPSFQGISHSESPRVLRRLQTLRRWSHEQEIKSFFTRNARTRCAHGAGTPGRIPIPMGGY
jgi:ribonuclease BN (tRNA processing enzyme)